MDIQGAVNLKKDRQYNGKKSTKHYTENYRSSNMNLTKKPGVNSGAQEE